MDNAGANASRKTLQKDPFIKRLMRRSALLVSSYRSIEPVFRALLYSVSPGLLARLSYWEKYACWPDLKHPRLFDEKLQWLMLNWQHPLKVRCADKYAVRGYVEEHGLGHLLPKLLGVYETSDQIDFAALPEQFVLKCTHGSGFNIFCREKRFLNIADARRRLDVWMKADISKSRAEIHYARIRPHILAEELLNDGTGDLPCDYKLFCFDGTVHCGMACIGRSSGHPLFHLYDRDWSSKLPYRLSTLSRNARIEKPEDYDKMVCAAQTLGKPFPFVRIDFYSIKGRAVFGEMTFTPGGCVNEDYTDQAQRELGALIKLPERWIEKEAKGEPEHRAR